MTEALQQGSSRGRVSRRIEMRTPEEVSAMLALKARGWGSKRIATEGRLVRAVSGGVGEDTRRVRRLGG